MLSPLEDARETSHYSFIYYLDIIFISEKAVKWYRELLYTLYSASLNVTILHYNSTIMKSGILHYITD